MYVTGSPWVTMTIGTEMSIVSDAVVKHDITQMNHVAMAIPQSQLLFNCRTTWVFNGKIQESQAGR